MNNDDSYAMHQLIFIVNMACIAESSKGREECKKYGSAFSRVQIWAASSSFTCQRKKQQVYKLEH